MVGLGAIALLVGGIGVANSMVISVLERRAEIGLRCAHGAARGQVPNAVHHGVAAVVGARRDHRTLSRVIRAVDRLTDGLTMGEDMLFDVRFRLLGAVETFDGERWSGVDPARCRQVLALLLCSPGQVVLVEHIVWALWNGRVPQTPSALVRNYIMKLRRRLARDAIVTRSGGYQLDIDPGTVDANAFEWHLSRARRAPSIELAGEALEEALGFWRGPALADARQCYILEREAERLEGLRTGALELRAELLLETASFAEAVSCLQPLVTAYPDRERLCELAVVALARDGRRAEALSTYSRFRDHHRAELGLDPSDRMAALQQTLLRGEILGWKTPTRRQINEK